MNKLEEIVANHVERAFLKGPYNEKIDYAKEAVQQYHEMQYLLCGVFYCLKDKGLCNDKSRKKDGHYQEKRTPAHKRSMQQKQKETKKRQATLDR